MVKQPPYYLVALAMAVPAVQVGLEIPKWSYITKPGIVYQSDFRVMYAPAFMLRTGEADKLYDFASIRRVQAERVADDNGAVPFLHPALEAALFIPFSYLPYRQAYFVWVICNFILLSSVYAILRHPLASLASLGPRWILPGLLVGFMPVAFAIFAGQDSLIQLLVLVLVFRTISSNNFLAGILLGLGSFRFQVLIPIILLFLLWRGYRIVLGWSVSTMIISGISAAITGVGAQRQYFAVLELMGHFSAWVLIRRMVNLRALFSSVGLGFVAISSGSLLILLLAFAVGRKQNDQQKLLLGISTSCLVTYYLFLHDLSILVLPILIALCESVVSMRWCYTTSFLLIAFLFSGLWFTSDNFYVAAILTLMFLLTNALASLNRNRPSCAG